MKSVCYVVKGRNGKYLSDNGFGILIENPCLSDLINLDSESKAIEFMRFYYSDEDIKELELKPVKVEIIINEL